MTEQSNGSQRLADLFEKMRGVPSGGGRAYNADDAIAILHLLARGYTIAEIERRTFVPQNTIRRWRNTFQDGMIEHLFPDIFERAEQFDLNLLPPDKVRKQRPMLSWQQTASRLEDRPNPYARNGQGNGHVVED